jgi:hypothetical protein
MADAAIEGATIRQSALAEEEAAAESERALVEAAEQKIAADEEEEKPATAAISPAIKDALSEMVLWRKTQKMARQPWAIIDMYDEYMQEDLTLIGRIMDRNRSVKQAFVNAHSAAY